MAKTNRKNRKARSQNQPDNDAADAQTGEDTTTAASDPETANHGAGGDGEQGEGAEPIGDAEAVGGEQGTAMMASTSGSEALGSASEAEITAVVDEVVNEIRALHHGATVEFVVCLGELIVERIFAGDIAAAQKPGPKDMAMKALVARPDLPVTQRQIYTAARVYGMLRSTGRLEEVRTSAQFTQSALEVIASAPPARQEKLLTQAADGGLTVKALKQVVAKFEKKSKGGKTPKSPIVRAVSGVERAAKVVATLMDEGEQVPADEVHGVRQSIAAAIEILTLAQTQIPASGVAGKAGKKGAAKAEKGKKPMARAAKIAAKKPAPSKLKAKRAAGKGK